MCLDRNNGSKRGRGKVLKKGKMYQHSFIKNSLFHRPTLLVSQVFYCNYYQRVNAGIVKFRKFGIVQELCDLRYMNNYEQRTRTNNGLGSYFILSLYYCSLYRVAQKECSTFDQSFQENEGQNEKFLCIIAYKILFLVR